MTQFSVTSTGFLIVHLASSSPNTYYDINLASVVSREFQKLSRRISRISVKFPVSNYLFMNVT